MRISDWSSDVCSSDLGGWLGRQALFHLGYTQELDTSDQPGQLTWLKLQQASLFDRLDCLLPLPVSEASAPLFQLAGLCLDRRSEEHTSELQSLMRISYAVFCLKKKKKTKKNMKKLQ